MTGGMKRAFSRTLAQGIRTSAHRTSTTYFGMDTYDSCVADTEGSDASLLIQCVSQSFEKQQEANEADFISWLMVLCGSMVFFMQTGFAMLCAGCVRKKNVQNTMLKNLLDACGAAVAFYSVGFAFSFGGQNESTEITFLGTENFFGTGTFDYAYFFITYTFSANATTIVAGTLAERCQMAAYLCYSLFITGFVYPVVAHALWSNNGFLSPFAVDPFRGVGVVDISGGGVVHLTGGTTALIATYILGARKGRFHDNRGRLLPTPRTILGHSIALQLMGTMVLWFGWFGFNVGSVLLLGIENSGEVAGRTAVNTSLAAAAGACSGLFINLYVQERKTGEYKFDLAKAMNGTLSALVAINASCATVESWASLLIGAIAGALYLAGSSLLVSCRLDDAVDAIPVHMVNGAWGLLAAGLFSSPQGMKGAFGSDDHVGFFYSLGEGSFDATLLGNQCLGLLFIVGWTLACMWPFFFFLNTMGWFRADSLEELVGLDLSYMGNKNNLMGGGDDFSDVGSVHSEEDDQKKNQVPKDKADAMSDLSGQL